MRPAAIAGRVWAFGHGIGADDGIIRYSEVPDLGRFDVPALKAMCFTLIDPDFPAKVRPGDVVVAGRNFGHHSHPHACVAMKESGIAACFVESTDSAFIRKALNVGLPVVPCRGVTAVAATGDRIGADLRQGAVWNEATGARCGFRPWTERMIDAWRAGGLGPALAARLAAAEAA